MIDKEFVFVYGTLKFGYSNSGFLMNSEIIGRAETEGKYSLWQWDLPYLTSTPNHKVKGEVYKVTPNVLSYLDSLEGHPHLYKRQKIKVVLEKGSNRGKLKVSCWGYFWKQPRRECWKLTNGEYIQKTENLWQ